MRPFFPFFQSPPPKAAGSGKNERLGVLFFNPASTPGLRPPAADKGRKRPYKVQLAPAFHAGINNSLTENERGVNNVQANLGHISPHAGPASPRAGSTIMHIRKAVITAAGANQDRLPLQRFVDVDGVEKTALQIILEEVIAAGIEEVCIVVRGGSQQVYREAAGDYARLLVFVEQPAPRGYGEALYRAASFVGQQPFLHLVSDHLYISKERRRCAEQLIELARAEACSVSAVQPTREGCSSITARWEARPSPGTRRSTRLRP